jgi:serine/threonine protein kinase
VSDIIGQTIGNYRIEALLGTGAMGQVYRAHHIHLNRPAALKLMHDHMSRNLAFQTRFRQEARAIAALQHPNIVGIYDFGEQDKRLYLALEFVAAGSLRALLQQFDADHQPFPLALGLDLMRQAAAGLAYAHKQGMLHRDIKPDNMLLQRDAEDAAPSARYILKIADFGLARLADTNMMTVTGTAMGTPAYVSPEQCQGIDLDGRSDLYSLGVVLYEVATGYLPFAARTMSEAVYKHVNMPPPPPRQVRPDVPEAIEAIILRCLAKRPDQRFAGAAELRDALDRALTSQVAAVRAGVDSAPTVIRPLAVAPTPLVRVADQSGRELHAVALTGAGLTVGRLPESGIMLDSNDVSRQHLRIDWDGSQATITDLDASNGTLLGAARLAPRTTIAWDPREPLRVGAFIMRLDVASYTSGPGQASIGATSPPPPPQSMPGVPIAMTITPTELSVAPGASITAQISIWNRSTLVDHIQPMVVGAPPGCTPNLPPIQLVPGERHDLALVLQPPRAPQSRAGRYTLVARAVGRNAPERVVEARATLDIGAYTQLQFELRPQRRRSVGRGSFRVRVANQGNADATVRFEAIDPEDACEYTFDPPQTLAPPGQEQWVALAVRARTTAPSAEPRTYRFVVLPKPADAAEISPLAGEWEALPLELDLRLQAAAGVEKGAYTLELNNRGSTDLPLELRATSADERFGFTFDRAQITVPANQQHIAKLTIALKPDRVAQPEMLLFTVTARLLEAPEIERSLQGKWWVVAGPVVSSSNNAGAAPAQLAARPPAPQPTAAPLAVKQWSWWRLLLADIVTSPFALIVAVLFFEVFLKEQRMELSSYAGINAIIGGLGWLIQWLFFRKRVYHSGRRSLVSFFALAFLSLAVSAAAGSTSLQGNPGVILPILPLVFMAHILIMNKWLRRP